MQEKYGEEEYNIIPDTYTLPDQYAEFAAKFRSDGGKWIIKPTSSS
jgi:hypothetical protein